MHTDVWLENVGGLLQASGHDKTASPCITQLSTFHTAYCKLCNILLPNQCLEQM